MPGLSVTCFAYSFMLFVLSHDFASDKGVRLVERELLLNEACNVSDTLLTFSVQSSQHPHEGVLLPPLWRWKSRLIEVNEWPSHTARNGRTQERLCCLFNIRLPSRGLRSRRVRGVCLSLWSFLALVKAETLATWRIQSWGWFSKASVWYHTFSKLCFPLLLIVKHSFITNLWSLHHVPSLVQALVISNDYTNGSRL